MKIVHSFCYLWESGTDIVDGKDFSGQSKIEKNHTLHPWTRADSWAVRHSSPRRPHHSWTPSKSWKAYGGAACQAHCTSNLTRSHSTYSEVLINTWVEISRPKCLSYGHNDNDLWLWIRLCRHHMIPPCQPSIQQSWWNLHDYSGRAMLKSSAINIFSW